MNISPIRLNVFNNHQKKDNKAQNSPKQEKTGQTFLPTTAQYLAFTGGKSLSLKETKAQLDKFSSYPPDIKEKIEEALQNGEENKTLIDIHREKYGMLKELDTLEEIKFFFPEFEDVLSDNEVDYRDGSFIDDVKKGKIEYFDPDKDVSVQLIQMYWGDGFSLNDLKNEFAGKNVYQVFEKLNIQRVDKTYGHYLKFSDKAYNERFTSEMSRRAKEIERQKIEKKEGVYIPRSPLTQEHKDNISKGLKKYYSEHPEKIAEMSERHLKFYEENPIEKDRFSEVLKRAWNYREAKPLRKALSRFMKKQGINEKSEEEMMYGPNNPALKDFWRTNEWAKKVFSSCMTKSWARQDELSEFGLVEEPLYSMEVLPDSFKKEVKEFAKDSMPDIERFITVVFTSRQDAERTQSLIGKSPKLEKAIAITSNYFRQNNNNASKRLADTINLALIMSLYEMKTENSKNKNKYPSYQDVFASWNKNVRQKSMHSNGKIKANDLRDAYSLMVEECVFSSDINAAKLIDKNLNVADKIIRSKTQEEYLEYFYQLLDKFQA